MRTPSRPATISDTLLRTPLALAPRALATAAVAGLCALSIVACGDDKKTTGGSGNNGAGTGNDTPAITNPNSPAGTTPGGATGTNIKVVLDGGAASNKDGLYAVLSPDATVVSVYPYDFCAWAATHDANGTMAAAEGDGLVLFVGPTGTAATAGNPYTVNKQTTASDGVTTYDKNVVATYKYPASGNSCDITTRGALSGTVNWTTVSSTQVSGNINATVIDYGTSSTSTVTGTFVASKCPSYNFNATPYNSDTLACHDAADQVATKTSNGLHYK